METLTLRHNQQRGYGVYTTIARKKGDKIYQFEGNIVPTYMASVYRSMSLNKNFSLEWKHSGIQCYFNHSCNPNCYFEFINGIPVLTAIRDISEDEELCYNYNTIEIDLTKDWIAFNCYCGESCCIGWIRGFMYITLEQESKIKHMLSPYMKEILAEYDKCRD